MTQAPTLPVVTACDGCGVCCLGLAVPPYDNEERALLAENLPLLFSELEAVETTRQLQLRVTGVDSVPCGFFNPVTRKCNHYQHRPDLCYLFTVGGVSCQMLRADAGL